MKAFFAIVPSWTGVVKPLSWQLGRPVSDCLNDEREDGGQIKEECREARVLPDDEPGWDQKSPKKYVQRSYD